MLILLLLAGGSRYAYAQNTPGGPYIDSWHRYSVTMSSSANTYKWFIYSTIPDAQAETPGNELVAQSWIDNMLKDATTAWIDILFDDAIFNPGTYYLVYAEYSGATCTARRIMEITVSVNNFLLSLPPDESECNSYSGRLWPNTINPISNEVSTETIEFTVSMTKDADFLIDSWSFDAVVTLETGGFFYNLSVPNQSGVSTQGGTWSLSGVSGGSFTMTVNTVDLNTPTDKVTFRVEILGNVTEDAMVKLVIDNGVAKSGGLGLGTLDKLSHTQQITMYGVPNTSLVTISP